MGNKKDLRLNKKSESEIERYLVSRVKGLGGKAYKWVSPGNRGVPDRIVILPWSFHSLFVEVKAEGEKPSAQQRAKHRELKKLNRCVEVVDSFAAVDTFLVLHSKVMHTWASEEQI